MDFGMMLPYYSSHFLLLTSVLYTHDSNVALMHHNVNESADMIEKRSYQEYSGAHEKTISHLSTSLCEQYPPPEFVRPKKMKIAENDV
jgi:hypothetical protein